MTFEFDLFTHFVMPLLIFLSRVADVGLGTIRLIFITKGMKRLAPLVGFFEMLVWVLAMGVVMKNLNNPISYIAYAGGFAAGSYIGILLAEKMALGKVMLRVLIVENCQLLLEELQHEGYGFTVLDGRGAKGPVKIVFSVIKKKDLKKVIEFIDKHHPKAFYSVGDVGSVREGIFPTKYPTSFYRASLPYRLFRKGK
ncbi:DUF2179 domain-containing protein [Sedimentisphaera salicampi]|uniref:UPF0316 protein STSP1_01611 n=1 Tax=Sedimentisphaera salicampi TaxID=1941349 RepID=A0A1W6LN99_9BACT|nr:DUF2179 domain-containing protein [Sedimentisphaera salicampi]ARN57213.1 hypothetical protein STSP1_01611 [Sedimentisphaera salicampi]